MAGGDAALTVEAGNWAVGRAGLCARRQVGEERVRRPVGVVRLAMLAFVGIAVLVALSSGQWSAAGVCFLLFAILMPNYRKRAKLRARART